MPTLQKIAVVGAGFMGSGIAESAAAAGVEVVVYEPEAAPLERARTSLAESVERAVAREKLTRADADGLISRIGYTTSLGALDGVDAVIEAVYEDVGVKGRLFEEIDARLPDAAFIASNTSSIPIAQLAVRTNRPERVVGLHFFSPVPVMKLVEVVATIDSSPEAVDAAEAFGRRIGKQPIRAKDRAGFVVNMLLVPYLTAAIRMLEEGFATREDIDTGMAMGCGHPMGPLTLSDFVGLDVIAAVCESLYEEFRRPEYAAPPLLRRMVTMGHLGRKTGQGFYEYASGKRPGRGSA